MLYKLVLDLSYKLKKLNMFDPILLLIAGVFMIIGWLVSNRLKSKFEKYSQYRLLSGMTGKDVAERMLKENGIYDVKVISVAGQLTDHYNPANKTVNLSEGVYGSVSIAAAAVAAHECGHAVQHATAYSFLQMRSKLVPVVNIASMAMNFLTFGLALLAGISGMYNTMLLVFIVLQGLIALFAVITLPVEVDASKRALAWLESSNAMQSSEKPYAYDALKWAAYTYFVSAIGAIATLLYYVWRFTSSNRN
jgi:uncharacterized protein